MTDFTEYSQQKPRGTQHNLIPTAIQTRQIADLAVTNAKISSLSFDKAVGGTLTLGGVNNVSGLFSLKNASGTEIVHIDNTGIQVYDGSIVIKNVDNTTILDTAGIVSTANFITDQISSNSSNTTASTSFVDVPGSSMNPFVLERETIALITVFTKAYNVGRASNTNYEVGIQVNDSIDGNLIGYSHNGNWIITGIDFVGQSYGLSVVGDNITISAYLTLNPGTHILKIQYKAISGGTATEDGFILNYNLLGS